MKKIDTIVFPVGGLGTRFLPATKAIPKEMLPVAEKPLIQYAFEEAMEAGIEKFIFVTGRNKNSIEDHFDNAFELQTILNEKKKENMLKKTIGWMPPAGHIIFLRQQEPMGLGHAVLCARKYAGDGAFAVTLADDMNYGANENFLKKMIDLSMKNNGANVVGLGEVEMEKVGSYGIAGGKPLGSDSIKIDAMVEKPSRDKAPSNLSLIGKYIFQPEIFNYLEKTPRGVGNEIQLTDAMNSFLLDGKREFLGLIFKDRRFDCGCALGYLEANIYYALKNSETSDEVKKIIAKFGKPSA
ncbi:MAG: UTP--glucose-1-phosphate uridylyltransferase [Rickettsiales bacterium]|jgi:UTP-glucose-1-phosphate uridylyltransferase|nr:UTP--glucose-1-phosphate uridylyltransferase [Rickettsiales bacterium]